MEYTSQRMVMYPHLNAAGILFGGMALSWIDEEAIIFSSTLLKTNKIALVKMSEVSFLSAANIGDIVMMGCELVKVGTTSITVRCEMINKTTNKVILHIDEIVIVSLDFNKKPIAHNLGNK